MRYIFLFYAAAMIFISKPMDAFQDSDAQDFVISTMRIALDRYPNAYNPSLIAFDKGFLLTFRHCLAPKEPWVSHIGMVMLDDRLQPISKPQMLDTRKHGGSNVSQSEDARIFVSNNKIYIVYNDNLRSDPPGRYNPKRDMFIAQVLLKRNQFYLAKPQFLMHTNEDFASRIQKNWTPFEWQKQILLIYSNSPHEVLFPDFKTGRCEPVYSTDFDNKWQWGVIRGGSPAQLVDGAYLSFFHSSQYTTSYASKGVRKHHYFMGAYTFSAEPPFEVLKMSKSPIIGKGFYSRSESEKKVIFPGGFAIKGPHIYIAYGKDDCEVWVAVLDKDKLMKSLVSCQTRNGNE